MKSLKVAKLSGASKEEKKAIRKKIRKELKEQGFEKEEIKAMIKENLKKDKEQRIVLLQEKGEEVSDIEIADEGVIEGVEQEVEVEQEISVDEPSVELV